MRNSGRASSVLAMDALEGSLGRLRSWARLLLVARGLAGMASVAIAAVVVVALLDFSLRLPAVLRWIVWMGGLIGLWVSARSLILPAIRFCPRLSDLALRLEASVGERPEGLLASALELDASDPRNEPTIQRAGEFLEQMGRWRALEAGRSARFAGALGGSLALAMLFLVISPTLSGIGTLRVVAPWSAVAWPKRTQIGDATPSAEVHPLGVRLDLAAALSRTPSPAGESRVFAMVRFVEDGQAGITMRLPMSARGDHDDASGSEIYRRRIEIPDTGSKDMRVEFWFESLDDASAVRSIRLAATPEIESAQIEITPPTYAHEALGQSTLFFAGTHDLGSGIDERAIVGPVLGGSDYSLTIGFNKQIPDLRPGMANPAWLADLIANTRGAEVHLGGDSLTIGGSIRGSSRIEAALIDKYGLVSSDRGAFSLDVLRDAEPTASVSEPAHDEGVLASALVGLVGEASDDIALLEISLERQIARPPGDSEGAPPEPSGVGTIVAVRSLGEEPAASRQRASVGFELDLATLDLAVGDEVWISALASDIFALAGETHAQSRSKVRRLTIVSEEQMVERLRHDLDAIRESAQRLDGAQALAERQILRLGPSESVRDQQASIGEQIQAQREAAERISRRMRRNRLQSPTLRGLVDDAAGALDAAGQAASEAASAIDQSVERGQSDARGREIERAQREVRDELGRLADMLSRGRDEWLMRRDVERLLSEQQRLNEQTGAIGRQTAGRSTSDLSTEELSELDRIAQRQRENAEDLAETLDDLNDRARELGEADPAQSAAMQQAADRGRQSQAEQSMRDAAQQLQQNQTGSAAQNQQDAIDSLEEMLDDLDSAGRNRDAALQRALASVIESLEGLIKQQERELGALDRGVARQDLSGLDGGMVRLYTNALGVHDVVRSQGAELASVADLLDQAIGAQEDAISGLRETPVDVPGAREGEQSSLARLEEAKGEAARLQEDAAARDQARKLAELRRSYREALEQQVALRGETVPLVDRTLSRRERQSARTLGKQQDSLRMTLREIRDATDEFEDAAMFEYAHERLDALMGEAAEDLQNGDASARTVRRQNSAVRILQGIIESIKESESEEDPFRDSAGGQSGGQGGGSGEEQPLLPPIAELKLLRAMQAEALAWTREMDDAGQPDSGELGELGELQTQLQDRGEELIRKMFQDRQGVPPGLEQEGSR